MKKIISYIKNHPITSILTGMAFIAGFVTLIFIDLPQKFCAHYCNPYYSPATIENNLHKLWIGTDQNDVLAYFGKPHTESVWAYKMTNGYFALHFDRFNKVEQITMGIPENTAHLFSGYRLPEPYNFNFGKDSFKHFYEEGYLTDIKVNVGAQTGSMTAAVTFPAIIARGSNGGDLCLKAFQLQPKHGFNHPAIKTFWGHNISFSAHESQILDFCDPPECTSEDKESAIQQAVKTIPGWIIINSYGEDCGSLDYEMVKIFLNIKNWDSYAGYFSRLCLKSNLCNT
jgi:hypothetical protein